MGERGVQEERLDQCFQDVETTSTSVHSLSFEGCALQAGSSLSPQRRHAPEIRFHMHCCCWLGQLYDDHAVVGGSRW